MTGGTPSGPLAIALIVLVEILGCLAPQATTCLDGRVCPPNSRCDVVNHLCITPTEEAACTGLDEGSVCSVSGASGACRQGICQPFTCGDGVRTAPEPCDGDDLGGQTCKSLGFYGQTTGLACSPTCMFDTSGCLGRCGDHQVNGPDEVCDGEPPLGKTCLDYGYDRGFLGCTALCNLAFGGCGRFGWQEPNFPEAQQFSSVWGANYHDVYASWGGAVEQGLMHWDGSTWSEVVGQAFLDLGGTLGAIWGSGPNDVWVLTSSGVLHWNGATWSASIKAADDLLRTIGMPLGIWGSGDKDIYLLGAAIDLTYTTTLAHWDGAIWSVVTIPSYHDAKKVWGTGPDDVYIYGGHGGSFGVGEVNSILHWDGSSWQTVEIDDGFSVTAMGGAGSADTYAVGMSGTGPLAYHWDGTAWQLAPEVPNGATFVGGSGIQNMFAANTGANDDVQLSFWTGERFAQVFNFPGQLGVQDSWGDATADNYLLDSDHTLYQPGPAEWFPALSLQPSSIWGSGDDLFVAASDRLVHFVTGRPPESWVYPQDGFVPDTIWGTSQTDLWGIARGASNQPRNQVVRWSGTEWDAVYGSWLTVDPSIALQDIGGSGPDDVWVVGTILSHWDGRQWSSPIKPPAKLHGVWARNPMDAYAAGEYGLLQHWDGARWTVVSFPVGSPVFTGPISSVWGTDHEVFAVGDGVVIHQGADGQWTVNPTRFPEPLLRVHGSGPGNVFVRGAISNTLYHLRSNAWEPLSTPQRLEPLGDQLDGAFWVTPKIVFIGGLDASSAPATFRLDLRGVDCVSPEQDCHDGWDNDCDGLPDEEDPDCAGKVAEQCANLVDDDGDGMIDCDDSDCAQFSSCHKP